MQLDKTTEHGSAAPPIDKHVVATAESLRAASSSPSAWRPTANVDLFQAGEFPLFAPDPNDTDQVSLPTPDSDQRIRRKRPPLR